jgi:hypothetical protein
MQPIITLTCSSRQCDVSGEEVDKILLLVLLIIGGV